MAIIFHKGKKHNTNEKRRGYKTSYGYKGWIPSLTQYILFATETDYNEYYALDIKQ